jgi:molecular chaperone DnaK (HSP70)
LSFQEIQEKIKEAKNYRVEDEKFLRKASVMNALDSCVYKIKNALEKKQIKLKLSSKEIDQIDRAIAKATNLLDSAQKIEIDVLENHLEELESSILFRIIGRHV